MNKQEVEEGIKDIVFEGEMCGEGGGGQNTNFKLNTRTLLLFIS